MDADSVDRQTVEEVRDHGDEKAMEELASIIAQRQSLFRLIALRYLGNLADAEDAIQDAFLSAVRHLKQFKRQAQMSTWLIAIVTNSARMKLRQRRRFLQTFLEQGNGEDQEFSPEERLFDHRPNPEELFQGCERSRLVMDMASQLSPVLRGTFRLRELDGLSVRETAGILGVPPGTVKAQTVRARARLQKIARDRRLLNGRAAIAAAISAPRG